MDLEGTLKASIGDRYDIERRLGAGAMAEVFLAFDRKHNRRVAVKVLKPELGNAIGADRFQREIEVLAGLTHPHILPLHDSGEAGGLLYFVTPWIEGESLRTRLERDGHLPVRDAVHIVREIAGALGYAHRRGIVHRDVKPANILLTGEHALLADFGIAHLADSRGATLTGTGLALGTPAYFSPEQAAGDENIDGRSDIYSLGCVLFEALTGEPPFKEDSVRALITRHIVDTPPRLRSRRPDVSEGIEAVVQTALRKEPERRFQTAEEMAGSLDMVSGGFEAMAGKALRRLLGPRHRWLHGKRLAALIAAATVVLVAGALILRSLMRSEVVVTGPEASYLLVPWSGTGSTPKEDSLAARAVRTLSFQLANWTTVRAVDAGGLEGPIADLQLAGVGAIQSIDDAELLAQKALVTHIVRLRVLVDEDSIALEATIRERRRGPDAEETRRFNGREDDLDLVTAGVAMYILGLHGEPAELNDLLARSPIPEAHQDFWEGRHALYAWRLAEAEEYFRGALEHDPGFALAHYYLAQTLYWRTARDPQRMEDLGPDIDREAALAVRSDTAGRLRRFEKRHVAAFRAFWSGRYDEARSTYDTILLFNPTDIEALLLRGSVEYEDPWLADGGEGRLVPRNDLGLARAMFDSAAYLKPEWELSLGRLVDIDLDVARAALGRCFGYEPPPIEPRPPYVVRDAVEQEYFCPAFEGGDLVWLPDSVLESRQEELLAGALDLHRATARRLDQIATVEGGQARPHEELARWLFWERSVDRCATAPERADLTLVEARSQLERALTIRRDTTPEDRARLAGTLLGAGDTIAAVALADRSLADLGDWRTEGGPLPPIELANVYLAADRPTLAATIIGRSQSGNTWAVVDPTYPDSTYRGGEGLYGTLLALRTLGFAGVRNAQADSLMRLVQGAWSQPGLSERSRSVIRANVISMVGPALALRPDLWEEWFAGLEEEGLEIPTAWNGLLAMPRDSALAREYLDEAIEELDSRPARWVGPTDYFMPILLASRLGEEALATGLMERAAKCPKRVEVLDNAWAMTLERPFGPGD